MVRSSSPVFSNESRTKSALYLLASIDPSWLARLTLSFVSVYTRIRKVSSLPRKPSSANLHSPLHLHLLDILNRFELRAIVDHEKPHILLLLDFSVRDALEGRSKSLSGFGT